MERVIARPVITDLVACVECRCVDYSPLPKALPPDAPRGGPPMPSGVVSDFAWAAQGMGRGGGSPQDCRVELEDTQLLVAGWAIAYCALTKMALP